MSSLLLIPFSFGSPPVISILFSFPEMKNRTLETDRKEEKFEVRSILEKGQTLDVTDMILCQIIKNYVHTGHKTNEKLKTRLNEIVFQFVS